MMKTVLLIAMFAFSSASANVWTTVYRADGIRPLETTDPCKPFTYTGIMEGTRLVIVVSSDTSGVWSGDLAIEGESLQHGILRARDCNESTVGYECSCLEAVTQDARVYDWVEPGIAGFGLQGHRNAVSGDWFILDYIALAPGICRVAFYDRAISWDVPIYELTFQQVPTRDFDRNGTVDFADFTIMAIYWQETGIEEPSVCQYSDINRDRAVDIGDMRLFADYWLYTTQ